MTPRPLRTAIATLSALTALTACNSSPEAGHPNTTATSPTATPTPTAPSTWTPEEQAAITAAKARYTAARSAVDKALQSPTTATRTTLLKAGNGGAWLIAVLGEIDFQEDNGWYQAGTVQIASVAVRSVKLDGPQPEVQLVSCIDSSAVSTRYQKNDKPVPMGPDDGDRHKFQSRIVYTKPVGQGGKMWFLIDDKVSGKC